MEVILLADDRNLGKRGDVVRVKPGYGRNYLIPHSLALEATVGNIKYFEQQRKKIDARHAQEVAAAQAMADQIGEIKLKVTKKVGDSGTLYGSVTTSEIADMLEAKGVTVDRRKIIVDGGEASIKTLGEHKVTIDLHGEVIAELTVTVDAEE